MRRWVLAVAAMVLVAGPTALAFFSGGYFDRPRLIAAIVAWSLVAVAALLVPRPLPSSTAGRLALAGLALLTLWTAVSAAWAPIGAGAQDDLQRLLLYLGYFAACLALLRGRRVQRRLEPALVLGALVVVGYALAERLLPGLVTLDRSFTSAGRLEQPLTYWNALGLLAAIGFVLAVRVAGDSDRGRALRAAAAAAGVPLGLGVYLTFARGALAAVVAGLVVLIALAPGVRMQLRSLVAVGGAAAIAALVSTRYPTVKALEPGQAGDSGDGLQMLVALVLLSLLAALLVLRRPRRVLRVRSLPILRPVHVFAVAGVLLLAGVLVAAGLEGKPEGESPARGADPARLGSIDSNRYRYWDVALRTWADHPLRGIGSGGFEVEWLEERDRVDTSADAHSLYLETAAELGIVGFAFLLMFVGGVVAGVVRLHRLDAALAAGPAAGLAAFAVHAGLDWDWEMPGVTLPALGLAAAALAWSEERAAAAAVAADREAPVGRPQAPEPSPLIC
jgi:hypothetical protein